jgi:hypothetical protein
VTTLTRICDLGHTICGRVSLPDRSSIGKVRLELKSLPLYSLGVSRFLAPGRSPTPGLILGLIITLAAVVAYSAYITRQISSLRRLQNNLVDRNRKDSLQLLRIQNDLNLLGLAMRDMLANDEPYPLTAWSAQFQRIREDLDDALRLEARVAVAARTPEQRAYLGSSVAQFWNAVDRTFALARAGKPTEARAQIQLTLQARQAALSTAVARLLVQNNASEEQAAQQIGQIYDRVQGQVYLFFTATLIAILLTSLYLIRSNRRLFAQLALLSVTSPANCTMNSDRFSLPWARCWDAQGSTRLKARRCAPSWKKSATLRRAPWTRCAACLKPCIR